MTPEEFFKAFEELLDPYVYRKDIYEFLEKKHAGKYGFKKYNTYAVFKEMYSRYKKKKADSLLS